MPKGSGSKSASSPAQHKLKRLGQLVSPRQPERERLTFAVYFPRPPYRGAQYRAARGKDGLYNFTGLVLGHGGATVQRIQKASGAKVEVRDAAGNLNGAHPSSHGDPSLHAWVAATSRQRLDKAVALLLEVLQPTNTQLRPITVAPGGSAVLQPVIPADWPGAAEAAAEAAAADAEAAEGAAAAAAASKPPPPPPPANAWASNRLLKAVSRQLSPVSSLQRSQGPTGSSNVSSEDEEGEAPSPVTAKVASREGAQDRPPPPPPPPPPRSAPQSPKQPAVASPEEQPAVPCTPEQPPLPRPAPHSLSPAHQEEQDAVPVQPEQQGPQAAGQQHMAVVFAKGLHSGDSGSAGLPVTPPASPQRSPVVAQLDFGPADTTARGSTAAIAPSASLDAAESSATRLDGPYTSAAGLDASASSGMSLDGAGSSAMSLCGTASSTAGLGPQLSGSSSRMLSGAPSSAASWSLWDQAGSGSSFYEQLQAAASDTFSVRTSSSSHSAGAAHLGGGHSRSPLEAASPAGALSPHLGSPPHAGTHMLPQLNSPRVLHHSHAHALAHMGSPRHLHPGPMASPLGSPPHVQHTQHAQHHAYLARQVSPRHLHAHPLLAHQQLAAHQQQHLLSHPLAGHHLQAAALQSHPLSGLPAEHPLPPQQYSLVPHTGLPHAQPSAAAPLLAPFPGLSRQGLGAGLASPSFGSPGLGSPPHAAAAALLQQQLLLAQAQQADAEHDMRQLLAAVASMATLDG